MCIRRRTRRVLGISRSTGSVFGSKLHRLDLNRTIGSNLLRMVLVLCLGATLAACGQKEEAKPLPAGLKAVATPGKTIPRAHVDWGMAPFPDESLPIVGMRQGFFKDVGIDIGPTASGSKVDCTASLAPLLTNKVQICSGALEALLPQLDNTQEVRNFVAMDTVVGLGIFIPPNSKAKGVAEFMKEGDDFTTAMHKAMGQLRGKRVALATDPAARLLYNIAFKVGGISPKDFKRSDLENPNIVTVALAGRTDFPAPSGGAEVVRLLQEGFRSLVTQEQIQKFSKDPRRFETAIHGSFLTTNGYYNRNYGTVLRAASVVYRIFQEARDDFPAVSNDLRPFINAYAGQNLSQAVLKDELTNFAQLRTFGTVGVFYNGSGQNAAANIFTTCRANIQALRRDGVLKRDHSCSEIIGSDKVWRDLVTLKRKSDDQFGKVDKGGSQAALVRAARRQYDNFNFLDSYRMLLSAANSG